MINRIVIASIAIIATIFGANAQSLVEQANKAYSEDKFIEALNI